MTLAVSAIDHLVLSVRDVEVSAVWFERVLGMKRHTSQPSSGGSARTHVSFGQHKINLRPVTASAEEWFTGATIAAGAGDLCFLTDTTPDEVADHMRRCGVAIVLGPVVKQGAKGEICSVYVRDPDGNLIEISSYR